MRSRTLVQAPLLAAALLAATSLGCTQAPSADVPTLKVAAAADLALVFPELAKLFEAETGAKVVFSFGSSGLLAHQIAEGGPFDVFASANVSFVDEVVAKGRCLAESRTLYGVGRVGLWSKTKRYDLDDLLTADVVKIGIPNPEHAPYGMAAKQALETSQRWEAVSKKLVYGENARQAMQLAESGNVEVAFVPLSLATGTPGGHFTLVDSALHRPLEQGIAACGPRAELGQRFVRLVMSERGRALMRKYGFLLPGETLSAEL